MIKIIVEMDSNEFGAVMEEIRTRAMKKSETQLSIVRAIADILPSIIAGINSTKHEGDSMPS